MGGQWLKGDSELPAVLLREQWGVGLVAVLCSWQKRLLPSLTMLVSLQSVTLQQLDAWSLREVKLPLQARGQEMWGQLQVSGLRCKERRFGLQKWKRFVPLLPLRVSWGYPIKIILIANRTAPPLTGRGPSAQGPRCLSNNFSVLMPSQLCCWPQQFAGGRS